MTRVFIKVSGKPSDPQDQGIPGRYAVRLKEAVPERHLANAGLDVFHAAVAVGVLDDFDFLVLDESGRVLEQAPDAVAYAYRDAGEVERIGTADFPVPSPQQFLVSFDDVAYSAKLAEDDPDYEVGAEAIAAFNAARASWPKGVVALSEMTASPDDTVYADGVRDGRVKLFMSIVLLVECENQAEADNFAPPVKLLEEIKTLWSEDLDWEKNWELLDAMPFRPAPVPVAEDLPEP